MRYAAFLRAVNLGRNRRVSGADLCAIFEELGFEQVASFRTSGNLVFEASRDMTAQIENALESTLGYDVGVFLRSAAQLAEIAEYQPFKPAQVESYTLTCERNGQVFDTQQVQIDRGQKKTLDLRACAAAIQRACASNTIGLRSVSAARRGGGVRFGFRRFARRPVQIDVFQVSQGRRIVSERLAARFKARSKAVTWNGKGARGDGLYFARYRMKTRNGKGTETRRVTLLRRNGRFSRRPDFYRRATCDLLPSYKLERAAFGGSRRRPLRIAYRVATAARAQVTVLRGKKVVKRFKARTVAPKRTHRIKLGSRKLARGDYKVRITVGRGAGRVSSTLVSRRL